jgi:hypothetical protein
VLFASQVNRYSMNLTYDVNDWIPVNGSTWTWTSRGVITETGYGSGIPAVIYKTPGATAERTIQTVFRVRQFSNYNFGIAMFSGNGPSPALVNIYYNATDWVLEGTDIYGNWHFSGTVQTYPDDSYVCLKAYTDGITIYGKMWLYGGTEPDWQFSFDPDWGSGTALDYPYFGITGFNNNSDFTEISNGLTTVDTAEPLMGSGQLNYSGQIQPQRLDININSTGAIGFGGSIVPTTSFKNDKAIGTLQANGLVNNLATFVASTRGTLHLIGRTIVYNARFNNFTSGDLSLDGAAFFQMHLEENDFSAAYDYEFNNTEAWLWTFSSSEGSVVLNGSASLQTNIRITDNSGNLGLGGSIPPTTGVPSVGPLTISGQARYHVVLTPTTTGKLNVGGSCKPQPSLTDITIGSINIGGSVASQLNSRHSATGQLQTIGQLTHRPNFSNITSGSISVDGTVHYISSHNVHTYGNEFSSGYDEEFTHAPHYIGTGSLTLNGSIVTDIGTQGMGSLVVGGYCPPNIMLVGNGVLSINGSAILADRVVQATSGTLGFSGSVRPGFGFKGGGGLTQAGSARFKVVFVPRPIGTISLVGGAKYKLIDFSSAYDNAFDIAQPFVAQITVTTTGVGRCFGNDNLSKDIEELLRGGIPIMVVPAISLPTLPDAEYRYQHSPSWCNVDLLNRNACDGMLPTIVGRRQGQYMPSKNPPRSLRDRTIARLT